MTSAFRAKRAPVKIYLMSRVSYWLASQSRPARPYRRIRRPYFHHHAMPARERTESTPLLSTSAIADDASSNAHSDAGDMLLLTGHSSGTTCLAKSYRRPSYAQAGGRGLLLSSSPMPESALNDEAALDLVREEAGLLKSNRIRLMPASCCGSVATATVDELEET